MTISELIKKYGDKIKNLNTQLDDNHNISFNDIDNELICKKYNSNSLNVFSNYGLSYENNEPIYLYNKIDSIEIFSDKLSIDCKGGFVKIECFAIINVFNNDKIYKVIKHKINPLYSFEGCEFNFINNMVFIDKNVDFYNKEIKISAKYGYCGILYKSSLTIIQESNLESNWIESDEEIIDVIAECNKNNISNSGDEIEISIKKVSVLNLYKTDNFGNITSTQKSSEIISDITNDSIILVDNPFRLIENNKILFPPQKINSPIRIAKIICKYKNFEKKLEIYQDKGPVVSYKSKFNFDDGSDNKIIKLNSCLNDDIEIKIISYKIRFLDGIEYDKIEDSNIIIEKDIDWTECKLNKENLTLDITISKNSTNSIRTGNIILNNNDKKIHIFISQPSKTEVKCEYDILINCDDEIIANDINEHTIRYVPIKRIYYDDSTIETIEYLDPFYKLDVLYNISDDKNILITSPKMIDFNGMHESKIYLKNDTIFNDINVCIKCRIIDNYFNQVSKIYDKNISIHFVKPKVKDIEITINVINKSNYPNAYSKNNTSFKILNSKNNIIYESTVSNFWVSSFMNNDLVFFGNVMLNENESYKFIIGKYYYLDKNTEEISEEYIIESDDAGIDLTVNI